MGAWYLCLDDARAAERLQDARDQFRRHSLPQPQEISAAGHVGLVSAHIHQSVPAIARSGPDFIAVAGTFFYRACVGEQALLSFLADFAPPAVPWNDILGHFAALVFKDGKLHIFTDWAGHYHVYKTADNSVFATSFLATARSAERLRIRPQAVFEFVFAGTPLGSDTVFEEISRPCQRDLTIIDAGVVQVLASTRRLPIIAARESFAETVDRLAARLRAMFETVTRHYGSNIQCPLSGGFDSRLVLSLLMERGLRPHVYVYGNTSDPDVEVAREIADAENFDLEVFDKSAYGHVEPDAFPGIVASNFEDMDGTPMDGGLFDGGGNAFARHRRAAGGALAVSGAAGEIFRNYFYLADRGFPTRAVIDSFYAAFDPAEASRVFRTGPYLQRLDEKLQNTLEVKAEVLHRLDIERAYPLFRCPAAFGREISMVGRCGPYFVPFCEYSMVKETVNLPVRLRTHGVLQSALLTKIHPRLAAYRSAYGHSFTKPPNLKHRFSDAISLCRPPWLRRYSYRMKSWRAGAPRPRFLSDPYLSRVIDLEFPIMRRFFSIDRVKDPRHYGAIATLEYLFQRLSNRITL